MEYKSLKFFGLTDQEIEIYINLIRFNKAKASDLLQKVNLNRSVIYSILNSLIKKGFITKEILSGTTYFKTIGLDFILKKYKENEKLLEKEFLELSKISKQETNKPKIQILQGHEGILTLINDALETKHENLVLGEEKKYNQIVETYAKQYQISIDKLGIKERVLARYEFKGNSRAKNSEVRHLPKGYEFPNTTVVYGDKVVIVFWYDHLTFIWIEDKGLSESYRSNFEILWKIARK